MKVQVIPRFPAQIVGAGGISVTTANGIVTIGFSPTVQLITVAGTITVLAATELLVINKSAPSATSCLLPSVALRDNVLLEIFDFSGLGGDITLIPSGTDQIMGGTNPWVIASGGVAQSGGALRMRSLTALGGWLAAA